MTVRMKVSISRVAGVYDPENKLMMVQGEILLRPFEMNHTKKSELAFELF